MLDILTLKKEMLLKKYSGRVKSVSALFQNITMHYVLLKQTIDIVHIFPILISSHLIKKLTKVIKVRCHVRVRQRQMMSDCRV